ncbi:MAG: TfoX/Sxy family DNA transformation protein [Bdellovibrio sp.]
MAKSPRELIWIEDLLPEGRFQRRPLFGGFAYYIGEKMVMALFESPGSKSYKGENFDFELWNGCMFPVDHEYQTKARARFSFLVSHPILSKWLYLPLETEGFEELIGEVLVEALRPSSYWGTIPKPKNKGRLKSEKKTVLTKDLDKIDTRRPRMFADIPAEEHLAQAKKISDLKNLGPVAQDLFIRAGIKTPQQFIKMGWQKALVKLVSIDKKCLHSLYAYSLIGALKNQEFNLISDEDKQEARDFTKSLRLKMKKKK